MTEIPAMLKGQQQQQQQQQQETSSGNPAVPEVAIIKDGQLPTKWEPIGGMGHSSCVWCHLRGSLAGDGASGLGVSDTGVLQSWQSIAVVVHRALGASAVITKFLAQTFAI